MNAREIIFLDGVSEDLKAGMEFYDEREYGIGSYFFDSTIADIESLRIYAGIHSKHFGSFRMTSKRFPFAIYYELQDNLIIIIAILDMRRNPTWLSGKIKNRGK